jgi:hypothetical protein
MNHINQTINVSSPVTKLQGFIQNKKTLWFVLFVGFLLRLYISFFVSLPHIHTDSVGYFQQADTLLAGGYTNYFPNGYPLIIAMLKLLAGSHIVSFVLCLNLFLSTCTIYFIYKIGKLVFQNELIAITAAFILAVFPTQINYVRWFTSEVPFTFCLLGGYMFYYMKKNWISGLLFGFATIIRTEILPVIMLIVIVEYIFSRKANLRLVIGTCIPILFICTYCYSKTGMFSMAGHDKINILYAVTASGNNVDWEYDKKHPEVTTTGGAVKLYMDFLKEHPGQFFKNKLANYWELWGFYPSSSNGNRGVGSRLMIGLSNLFLLGFGLFAWWKNRKDQNCFILVLPFLIVTLVHVFLTAVPRYTYPVEPFMILLASWSIFYLTNRSEARTLKNG